MKGLFEKTIVVVDDNPSTLYSTARVLRSAGFEVLEAINGQEALALSRKADLVVLDVNLPDIDGYEVCRLIREDPATQSLPVIHLSATFVRETDKAFGLDAGADGYLTHPVEPPVLTATVRALLRTTRAEEQLHKSESKYRAIFSETLSGICLLDESFRFLEANPAMCGFFGTETDQLLGKRLSDYTDDSGTDSFDGLMLALHAGKGWSGELLAKRPDGRRLILAWQVSPYADSGNFLGVAGDVTERKRLLGEMEKLLENERNLLQSERLARREAENAGLLKDEFLATLSHELRTPLNAILGWAQLLSKASTDPQRVQEGIGIISRNARLQTRLIEDLLDMSRIVSGKLSLELESVDLTKVVSAAVNSVRPTAQGKGISVEVVGQSDVSVRGDRLRLHQVLWNLLSNAVKFTSRGGSVKVSIDDDPETVSVAICDSGKGIEPEFLPYVFDRFRQADASTTRRHGGLGLGLAIVKQLMDLHGGTVSVESGGPGCGSTFSLRLPKNAELLARHEAKLDEPNAFGVTEMPTTLMGKRILIVDDEEDARRVVKEALTSAGAEIDEADSYDMALAMLSDQRYDLLLSDIGMPKADGLELIQYVRNNLKISDSALPAIALTAFARKEDVEKALHAGFRAHIPKPLNLDQLASTVSLALRG